jgi:cytochrome c553
MHSFQSFSNICRLRLFLWALFFFALMMNNANANAEAAKNFVMKDLAGKEFASTGSILTRCGRCL